MVINYSKTATPTPSFSVENTDFYDENPFNLKVISDEFPEKLTENRYIVEINQFFLVKNKVFYRILLKKNGKIDEIDKKYEDFKELHEGLKAFAKKIGENIEELPNKGNLGIFPNENEIANYRKFALSVFLKYLLQHEKFKNNEILLSFIGVL